MMSVEEHELAFSGQALSNPRSPQSQQKYEVQRATGKTVVSNQQNSQHERMDNGSMQLITGASSVQKQYNNSGASANADNFFFEGTGASKAVLMQD